MNKFDNILESLIIRPGTLIIVGDFNINMARDTFYSLKLKDIVIGYGTYQLIREFTRITNVNNTTIDLVISNNKYLECKIHLRPKITDHAIITIKLQNNDILNLKIKEIRDFSRFNDEDFKMDLSTQDWDLSYTNIDQIFEKFVHNLIGTLKNTHH